MERGREGAAGLALERAGASRAEGADARMQRRPSGANWELQRRHAQNRTLSGQTPLRELKKQSVCFFNSLSGV